MVILVILYLNQSNHKPTLEEVNKRIENGKKLSDSINDGEYKIEFKDDSEKYKTMYFMGKKSIFDESEVIYSLTFDETEYINDLEIIK